MKELEQLRMENDYLKKLNALVQERTKPKQKKIKMSPVNYRTHLNQVA